MRNERYFKHENSLQRAFTLVELLVVIAIIGSLVALLLPAIQAAREAARRTHCINNLKNIALAVLNYESSRKALPPGKLRTGSGGSQSGNMTNWAIESLPFLEEQVLYDLYDHTKPNNASGKNRTVIQTPLAVMNCPSDGNAGKLARPLHNSPPDFDAATGSYRCVGGRGITGTNPEECYWDTHDMKIAPGFLKLSDRGPLHLAGISVAGASSPVALTVVRLKQIVDGTSKTFMIGEHATKTEIGRAAFWAYGVHGANLGTIVPNAGSYALDPDYIACRENSPDPTFPAACRRNFASLHPGGIINFALCDESVSSVSNANSTTILGNLATIAGNETNISYE